MSIGFGAASIKGLIKASAHDVGQVISKEGQHLSLSA